MTHNGPLDRRERQWIAALVAGRGQPAILAGISALTVHGLRGYDSDQVHVYLPPTTRCTHPPPYLVVHRTSHLDRTDMCGTGPPRTATARATLDAARWATSDDLARIIIAAAFQQRLVNGTAMRESLARMPSVARRSLIAQTINDAAGGSQSAAEQDFLRLCRRYRLPVPTRQASGRDASGRRRYRDAYFEPWRVHVEIDGGQHMEVSTWSADMQRQNEMWIEGDRVLRFPAWALRHEPRLVAATVRAALVAAGWSPPDGRKR